MMRLQLAFLAFLLVLGGCRSSGAGGPGAGSGPGGWGGGSDTRLAVAYIRADLVNDHCRRALRQAERDPAFMPAARRAALEARAASFREEALAPLSRWWINRTLLLSGSKEGNVQVCEGGVWRPADVTVARFYELFEADVGARLEQIRKDEDRLAALIFPLGGDPAGSGQ